jgi:hypothetical protein
VHQLIYWLLVLIGLLGPGWLLNRALGTNAGPTGAFLGSSAIIMTIVLALDSVGLALNRANVAISVAAISIALLLLTKLRLATGPITTPKSANTNNRPAGRAYLFWLLATVIGFAGATAKIINDPISGYDTIFRWEFLARQMFQQGALNFYPPVKAADFLHYPWPDGIAPLISSLYFWAYISLDDIRPAATTLVVMMQTTVLFWCVYELAFRRTNRVAGVAATALLATSSLALWGVCIGQETGMTALAFVGMFLFLERQHTEPEKAWGVWVGVAAGVGSLAREYGLVFAGIAALALLQQRGGLRTWMQFVAAFIVVALPWYLRNTVRTGNPLWPHSFSSLLPGNIVHEDYMREVAKLWGPDSAAWPPFNALRIAALLSLLPLTTALVHAFCNRDRRNLPLAAAIFVMIGLWLWSLSSTSAGHVYALRILTPAIALAAVLGGATLNGWSQLGWGRVIMITIVLIVAAVDAAARVFFLPTQPKIAWWRTPSDAWLRSRAAAARWNTDPNWGVIAASAGNAFVLVSDPFSHVALIKQGARPLPLFSPAVGFLFEPQQQFLDGLERLRATGIRFILLSPDNVINAYQLPRYPFFRALLATEPTARVRTASLYDLDVTTPAR